MDFIALRFVYSIQTTPTHPTVILESILIARRKILKNILKNVFNGFYCVAFCIQYTDNTNTPHIYSEEHFNC